MTYNTLERTRQLDDELLQLLKDGQPRYPTELARELRCDTETALRHLLFLAVQGKLKYCKTSQKLLFWRADKEQAQPVRVGPVPGPTRTRQARKRSG